MERQPARAFLSAIDFPAAFLPFERITLEAVWNLLPGEEQELLASQVHHVNKVQRYLDWREINLYCMRWFKVRWPEEVLFRNRGEFVLGTVLLRHDAGISKINVWSVGGHVFSLESPSPMKPLRDSATLEIQNAHVDKRH